MFGLEGKTALVTGGTRGIGKAIAKALRDTGATVYITGTNDEKTRHIANELKVNGLKMDIANREEVKNGVSNIVNKEGGVDILVNNAGITRDSLFIRMKDEDWDEVINTNLTGMYNVTKTVVPFMVKRRSGRIINITSVVGFSGNIGQVNYSASKSAILGFTKSLSKELSGRGIRVNAIAPGYITTDMTQAIPEKVKEEIKKSIPMKREGKPEEVASVVVFLACDMSSYITGTVVHVNGGLF